MKVTHKFSLLLLFLIVWTSITENLLGRKNEKFCISLQDKRRVKRNVLLFARLHGWLTSNRISISTSTQVYYRKPYPPNKLFFVEADATDSKDYECKFRFSLPLIKLNIWTCKSQTLSNKVALPEEMKPSELDNRAK